MDQVGTNESVLIPWYQTKGTGASGVAHCRWGATGGARAGKIYVEVQLSGKRAEQLDRVMGRFEEYGNSPSNTCQVILEKF